MKQEQRLELKEVINQKIEELNASIVEYKELTAPVSPDVAYGRISRMDAINNKSVIEAALRESEAKLKRLKVALFRINDDDFGTCIICKNDIPFNRLKYMPDSVRCVECASR